MGGVVGAGKYAIENAHKSSKSNQGEIPLWKQLTDFGQYKDGAPTRRGCASSGFYEHTCSNYTAGME